MRIFKLKIWNKLVSLFTRDDKYYKQTYPVGCKSLKGNMTNCKDCKYCGETECQCIYPFKVVISSNIKEWVKYDPDYRGISTYKDFVKKIPVAEIAKKAKIKKYEAKKMLLQAGASYLAALELCKELGVDIKDIHEGRTN